MSDESPNEKPAKTWFTDIKGGRRGVCVQCWKNYTKDGRPYPVFKLQVGWRKKMDDPWEDKITWNSSELETLYYLLKRDAIPYGYKVLRGLV